MAEKHGYFSGGGKRHDAPFVMKVRFYDPSLDRESTAKNAAHILYIGHRVGVDKGSFEPEKGMELDLDTPGAHVEYAHRRPRSHGLFTQDEEPPVVADIQKELKNHKGLVWRFVLSLKDTDAVRLGMTTRDDWEKALRASVGSAAEQMGIGYSNMRWVAAFHDEPGHPHVHLVLWEKNPKRKLGVLAKQEFRTVKREFMREIYARERLFLNTEKTMMREMMRELTYGNVLDKVDLIRQVRKEREQVELLLAAGRVVPVEFSIPKIHEYQSDEFAKELETLAKMLPGQGRAVYQFMPPEVKEKLDEMAKWLIAQPQFKESRERYFAAVKNMTLHYSMKPEDIAAAIKKAENDLAKRLAQIILRGAVESTKNINLRVDPDKAQIVINQFSMASKEVIDQLPVKVIEKHIEVLRQFGFSVNEQKELLKAWSEKADLQISFSNIVRMIEEPEIEEGLRLGEEERPDQSGHLIQILKFSGKSNEEVTQVLEEKKLEVGELEALLSAAGSSLLKAEQTLINERDWKKVLQGIGISDVAYPWKVKESSEIITEKSKEAIEGFSNSKFQLQDGAEDKDDKELGWTAFTMTVALKHMNYSREQQTKFMEDWIERNGYSDRVDLKSIFDSLDKNEKKDQENEKEGIEQSPKYLRKKTWERLVGNLGLQLEYPWLTKEELVLDPQLHKDAVEKIEASAQIVEEPKERMWLAEKFIRLIQNDPEHEKNYVRLLEKWEQRHGSFTDEERKQILYVVEKRTKDIDYFAKQYEYKDEMYRFVNDFAKVLYAAGLQRDQVQQVIEDWKARSGSTVQGEKIDRAIAAAEKHYKDLSDWGREPVMSKKDFKELCKKLGVDEAPWMWRSDHQYNKYLSENRLNLAEKTFKAAGKAIVQEMKRNEAQLEMEKQRLARRIEKQADRDERETSKDNRGR